MQGLCLRCLEPIQEDLIWKTLLAPCLILPLSPLYLSTSLWRCQGLKGQEVTGSEPNMPGLWTSGCPSRDFLNIPGILFRAEAPRCYRVEVCVVSIAPGAVLDGT